MLIAEVVQGVPFDKVKPGNIFQFFDRDAKLHTAIKVFDEQCNGVAFLTDCPPSYSRATIYWVKEIGYPWYQDIMLEFPDATLLIKEFSQLPDGHKPEMGNLTIQHDGTTLLLTNPYSSSRYVDMKTGKTVPPDAMRTAFLVVSRWAVVVPTGTATMSLVKFPEDDPAL
jgi:hypothetical protein